MSKNCRNLVFLKSHMFRMKLKIQIFLWNASNNLTKFYKKYRRFGNVGGTTLKIDQFANIPRNA